MTSESPFLSYLDTNYVPSGLEAEGIASLIADRSAVASEIRAKLERLAKETQALQDQLDRHTLYIEKHKSIISSPRRFPDNVLVRIFLASCDQPGYPAIFISHVSRRWRKLALDTPLLWTRVSIHVHGEISLMAIFRGVAGQATLDRVSAYVKRSGEMDLCLSIKGEDPSSPPRHGTTKSLHEDLVTILHPTFPRWKHFKLDVPNYSPFIRLLQVPATRVPALESLTIDFESSYQRFRPYSKKPPMKPTNAETRSETPTDVESRSTTPTNADSRSTTPTGAKPTSTGSTNVEEPSPEPTVDVWTAESLTTLRLLGIEKDVAEVNVALPVHWSNLTYLQLRSGSRGHLGQHHAIPILAACVNLVQCSLTFFNNVDTQPLPSNAVIGVTLPKLRALELYGSEGPARGLASKLILPSLTNLTTIFTTNAPLPEGEPALVEWINQYGCQLLDVSFDYVSLTQSTFLHCLGHLPNVVRLEMTGNSRNYPVVLPLSRDRSKPFSACINAELLAHLTPKFSDDGTLGGDRKEACFCPKLKQLVCYMGSSWDVEEPFAKLILARYGDGTKAVLQGGVVRIEQVLLDFHDRERGGKIKPFSIMDAVYSVSDPTLLDLCVYYDAPERPRTAFPSFRPERVRSIVSHSYT